MSKRRVAGVLTEHLNELEKSSLIQGLDFSRAQLDILIEARDRGSPIEFEALGPYLADYLQFGGRITRTNLLPEDEIGLNLACAIRSFLPSAKLISLYDDYNGRKGSTYDREQTGRFTLQDKRNFRTSLIALFHEVSVLSSGAVDEEDFRLIPESSKLIDAERLVERLNSYGLITCNGNEIRFINDRAENPLYAEIMLRTKQGRWLCEALDAAAFLKPENQTITHLVVLPDYMKTQQDKVWEILRTLDISLTRYHNIFYNTNLSPQTRITN
ncbi:MAG TPA: hypothetical protein VLG36_00615 [Candidatus Chromulinivoraceae bacterium]|nr:hypothetical protein [Candidatus Chromulinivoraceae bacterium]